MAEALGPKNVEGASGVIIPVAFHTGIVGDTSSYYPLVQEVPTELGGYSVYYNPPATVAAVNIKASAGQLYGFSLYHVTYITPVFVGFYNSTTAPTIGTNTIFEIGVPYSGTAANGSHLTLWFPHGIAFSTGIGVGMHVGGIGATTAVTASQQLLTVWYK